MFLQTEMVKQATIISDDRDLIYLKFTIFFFFLNKPGGKKKGLDSFVSKQVKEETVNDSNINPKLIKKESSPLCPHLQKCAPLHAPLLRKKCLQCDLIHEVPHRLLVVLECHLQLGGGWRPGCWHVLEQSQGQESGAVATWRDGGDLQGGTPCQHITCW